MNDSCLLLGQWCGQDMDQYTDYSDNLLSGNGFTTKRTANIYFLDPHKNTEYIPEVLRLPGYPFLLTLFRLGYNNPFVALVINFLSFIGILFFSQKLIWYFLAGWKRLIAYGIIALHPLILFYTSKLGNADMFASVSTIGFLYAVFMTVKQYKVKYLFGIVFFGICTLFSRGNSIVFLLTVIVVSSIWVFCQRFSYSKHLLFVFLILLAFMGGWVYRNYTLTSKPIFSAYTGMNLFAEYIIFTPFQNEDSQKLFIKYVDQEYGKKFMETAIQKSESVPVAITRFSEETQQEVIRYMVHNAKDVLLHFLSAWKALFISQTFPWNANDFFAFLLMVQKGLHSILMIGIPFVPFILMKRRNLTMDTLFLWIPTIIFLLATAFVHGVTIGSRGILPVLPLCIILLFVTLSKSTPDSSVKAHAIDKKKLHMRKKK